MDIIKILSLFIVLNFLQGCGEPSKEDIKKEIVQALQKDNKISKEFIESLKIDYGNKVVILYNNCPKLAKENDKRLEKEYEEKRKKHKGFSWDRMLSSAMGDNIWDRSLAFREQCRSMRDRAASIISTIEDVKSVKILE